jgi:hypothetical protein
MRTRLLAIVVCATGCFGGSQPPPQCNLIAGPALTATATYIVKGNAQTTIPGGQAGFLLTANLVGGWRLTWTDTTGAQTCFNGIVYAASGAFSQLAPLTDGIDLTTDAQGALRFASAPGTAVHGFDFLASGGATDTVTIDTRVGDGAAQIFYTDKASNLVGTVIAPAAFLSQ